VIITAHVLDMPYYQATHHLSAQWCSQVRSLTTRHATVAHTLGNVCTSVVHYTALALDSNVMHIVQFEDAQLVSCVLHKAKVYSYKMSCIIQSCLRSAGVVLL
jgi:hypothetical protein